MAAAGPSKIVLHWLDKSRSQRILWLLEYVGAPYEVKLYHRDKNSRSPATLKDVHPLGKAPVVSVEVGEGKEPIVLAESGVIVEYLIDHYAPNLVPKRYKDGEEGKLGGETEAWLRYRYLMHFAEGSMMPFLVMTLIPMRIRKAPVPFFLKFLTNGIADKFDAILKPEIKLQYELLEGMLGSAPAGSEAPGTFFCGGKEPTGADFMLIFPLDAGAGFVGLDDGSYPKVAAYVKRIQESAAWKRSVDKIIELDGSYDGSIL